MKINPRVEPNLCSSFDESDFFSKHFLTVAPSLPKVYITWFIHHNKFIYFISSNGIGSFCGFPYGNIQVQLGVILYQFKNETSMLLNEKLY